MDRAGCRTIPIDTRSHLGENGEEMWDCRVVEEDRDLYYIYVFEDEKHKLFRIHSCHLNCGLADHFVYPEPLFESDTIHHLYDQMGEKKIFRKREDGVGYHHYL